MENKKGRAGNNIRSPNSRSQAVPLLVGDKFTAAEPQHERSGAELSVGAVYAALAVPALLLQPGFLTANIMAGAGLNLESVVGKVGLGCLILAFISLPLTLGGGAALLLCGPQKEGTRKLGFALPGFSVLGIVASIVLCSLGAK